jgi:hypothetical protein
MDGNAPLVIKTSSHQMTKNEAAIFELYSWKATTEKPFRVMKVGLVKGRISLKALLVNQKAKNLYLIVGKMNCLLLAHEDGFSTREWVNGQTYKLRVNDRSVRGLSVFSEKQGSLILYFGSTYIPSSDST